MMLLLRRGGRPVYFGPLGPECSELISYFNAAPGVEPLGQGQNPANWVLEAIGA
jgi:hypothetical protein